MLRDKQTPSNVEEIRINVFSDVTSERQQIPKSIPIISGFNWHVGEHNIRCCKISDPLRICFKIPDLDNRTLKIDVRRSDTIQDLYNKISQKWPGLRGRGFVCPEPESILITLQPLQRGQASQQLPYSYDETMTMERIELFNKQDTRKWIHLVSPSSNPNPNCSIRKYERGSIINIWLAQLCRKDTSYLTPIHDVFNILDQPITSHGL